jgi:glycosyltransferase involved in cell wall biosynthesis
VTQTAHRRSRVLMLVEQINMAGGAEVFAVGLATHLPRDRFDVRLCTTRLTGGFLERTLDEAGIPHFSLARSGRWDLVRFRHLYSYLRSERIDLLHAHMFGSNVWGTIIGRLARTPVIVAQEQTWSYEGNPTRKLIDGQLIARLCTRFVAVSKADQERMIRLERVKPEKTAMIPNAFVPRDTVADTDLRSELGIDRDAPVIGTAVVHRPQKALRVMIDAFGRLLQSLPETHLVIAGRGPCTDMWKAHASERGLDGSIHFIGPREDVPAVIDALDVAVLSSDFEGTPLFVFECMARDTPVVSTAVGGLPDIVDDGRTGLLVPRRDAESLAAALESLLADPGRREAMAAAARERLPDFSIERISARYADLYDDLLASRSAL